MTNSPLKIIAAFCAVLLLATAQPAVADSPGGAQFYAGGGGGLMIANELDDQCDLLDVVGCEDTAFGFKAFAGIRLNDIFGGEAGYYKTGEFELESTDAERSGFYLAGVVRRALAADVAGFAKVGFNFYDTKGGRGLCDWEGAALMFGLGVEKPVGANISIRGEWERFTGEFGDGDNCVDADDNLVDEIPGYDLDFFSASAIYRF